MDKKMNHVTFEYSEANQLMDDVDSQLSRHLAVDMENGFEASLVEVDYKKRAKLTKASNRSVQEVRPFCEIINPMQNRMIQMRINLSFLLENACYNVSFKSLAEDFAEYEFLSKEIKKEAKLCKNEAMKAFLVSATVLNTDFFKMMVDSAYTMKKNIQEKMNSQSKIYIDLDVEDDSFLEIDLLKKAFKEKIIKLKEDKKKMGVV